MSEVELKKPSGIIAAMIKINKEMLNKVSATQDVDITMRSGRRYSFKYAPLKLILSELVPILCKNNCYMSYNSYLKERADIVEKAHPNLSIPGETMERHGIMVVTATITHADGSWIDASIPMPIVEPGPKGIGSLFTYGKRYATSAVAGLGIDEDDDAGEASGDLTEIKKAEPTAESRQIIEDATHAVQGISQLKTLTATHVTYQTRYKAITQEMSPEIKAIFQARKTEIESGEETPAEKSKKGKAKSESDKAKNREAVRRSRAKAKLNSTEPVEDKATGEDFAKNVCQQILGMKTVAERQGKLKQVLIDVDDKEELQTIADGLPQDVWTNETVEMFQEKMGQEDDAEGAGLDEESSELMMSKCDTIPDVERVWEEMGNDKTMRKARQDRTQEILATMLREAKPENEAELAALFGIVSDDLRKRSWCTALYLKTLKEITDNES